MSVISEEVDTESEQVCQGPTALMCCTWVCTPECTSELHLLTLLSSALCQGDMGSSAGEVIWIVIEMLRGYRVEDSVEGEIQRVK